MKDTFHPQEAGWRNSFQNIKKERGIETAYRRLRSMQKFHNYKENRIAYCKSALIKYEDEDASQFGSEYYDSAEIANIAISRMLETEI